MLVCTVVFYSMKHKHMHCMAQGYVWGCQVFWEMVRGASRAAGVSLASMHIHAGYLSKPSCQLSPGFIMEGMSWCIPEAPESQLACMYVCMCVRMHAAWLISRHGPRAKTGVNWIVWAEIPQESFNQGAESGLRNIHSLLQGRALTTSSLLPGNGVTLLKEL